MINLYAYGKHTTNGSWWIDNSKIVHRLYYVFNGNATVIYEKKEKQLTAGNIYLIPPNKEFITIDSQNFEHLYFDYYCIPVLYSKSIVEIPGTLRSMDSFFVFLSDNVKNSNMEKDTALHFLKGILTFIDTEINLKYISEKSIIKALEIIDKNKMSITTKELADMVNLNESYFIRLFSRVLGITPMKYIRACRLSEGRLLIRKGCTISQAAYMCGYKTSAAFWKAMYNEFGYGPKSFLKDINK